jgi:hypothetical protein
MEIMKRIAQLVIDNPGLDQVDLNPVIVYERGAIVVDVRIFRQMA